MTAKGKTHISFRAINYHEAGAGLRSLIAWQLRAQALDDLMFEHCPSLYSESEESR